MCGEGAETGWYIAQNSGEGLIQVRGHGIQVCELESFLFISANTSAVVRVRAMYVCVWGGRI
jgi:hypothetical protein